MKLPLTGAEDAVVTARRIIPASYGVLAHVSVEPLDGSAGSEWLVALDPEGVEQARVRQGETANVCAHLSETLLSGVEAAFVGGAPSTSQGAMDVALETGSGCLRPVPSGYVLEGWGKGSVTLTQPGEHPAASLTKAALSGDTLYIGKADPCAGFSVLCFDLSTPDAPPREVLMRGAGRFSLNAAVAAMVPTKGGVLIGTAALAGFAGQVGNWNSELILLLESGDWDLIIGQPRFSLDGLKLPASGQTPGFGNAGNAAFSAILPGERTVLVQQEFVGADEPERRNVAIDLMGYQGGCRAWVSDDLITWEEVPLALPAEQGAITAAVVKGNTLWLGFEAIGATALPLTQVQLS